MLSTQDAEISIGKNKKKSKGKNYPFPLLRRKISEKKRMSGEKDFPSSHDREHGKQKKGEANTNTSAPRVSSSSSTRWIFCFSKNKPQNCYRSEYLHRHSSSMFESNEDMAQPSSRQSPAPAMHAHHPRFNIFFMFFAVALLMLLILYRHRCTHTSERPHHPSSPS